jgi:hypothetical protein
MNEVGDDNCPKETPELFDEESLNKVIDSCIALIQNEIGAENVNEWHLHPDIYNAIIKNLKINY